MSKSSPSLPLSGNRLLALLPTDEQQRLLPLLHHVPLEFKSVLHEPESTMEYAYFPSRGCFSAVTVMENGDMIEVATIGYEGMTGLPILLEITIAPNRVIVQVAGEALRMRVKYLQAQTGRDSPLGRVLAKYHIAFHMQVSQSVACNGLHPVQQRCCRWLLMTHDRVQDDTLPLTHEFLAVMLGVRRSSVTEVLQPLQESGLVRTYRGKIMVLDRTGLEGASCEWYRIVKAQFDRLLG